MSKNAISLLQEHRQKRAETLPTYDEICATVGMHPNKFKYRCTCGPYKTDGEGPNKKDAKANAAEAMMNILSTEDNRLASQNKKIPPSTQQGIFSSSAVPSVLDLIGFTSASTGNITSPQLSPNTSNQSNGSSPVATNNTFVNGVGRLQELCVRSQLKIPSYEDSAVSNGFCCVCTIGTHEARGNASTKKQAKHNSAEEMLRILKEKYPQLDRENPQRMEKNSALPLLDLNLEDLKISNPQKEENITKKVKSLFSNLKENIGVPKIPKDTSFQNFHIIFKNSFDQQVLNEFHNFYNTVVYEKLFDVNRLRTILNKICSILAVESELNSSKVDDQLHMVEFKLNSYPPFSNIEIENSHMIAEQKCLSRSIYKIHFLLM